MSRPPLNLAEACENLDPVRLLEHIRQAQQTLNNLSAWCLTVWPCSAAGAACGHGFWPWCRKRQLHNVL